MSLLIDIFVDKNLLYVFHNCLNMYVWLLCDLEQFPSYLVELVKTSVHKSNISKIDPHCLKVDFKSLIFGIGEKINLSLYDPLPSNFFPGTEGMDRSRMEESP